MKTISNALLMAALVFSSVAFGQAQKASPNYPPPQAPAPPPSLPKPVYTGPKVRLLVNYDYMMVSPGSLNDYRAGLLYNNTTRSRDDFNNLQGFSLGAGYRVGDGFASIEYSHATQELSNTLIQPTTTYIQDTFEYDSVYALYDWVIENGSYSYEFGGGVGYALTYKYHNILSNNGATEDLAWQDNPVVAKVRANFNYHFSDNVRARLGATYEYATSSNMTADGNHPSFSINGTGVVSGQKLKTASGSDVDVNMSGFRLNAGLVVAF